MPTDSADIAGRLKSGQFTGSWVLDSAASSVALKTKAMFGILPVKGAFSGLTGAAEVGPTGAVTASLKVAADSLSTKMKKRDEHLRSADFFDAANHPQMIVEITDLGPDLMATGTLTVKGTSTAVSFPVTVASASATEIVVDATVTVDRSEVGIGFKKMGATKMLSTLAVHAAFNRS